MKTFKLKYKIYQELQSAEKKITLDRLIYEIAKNIKLQNDVDWIILDNVTYILSSIRHSTIKQEDLQLISKAVKNIEGFGYFEVEERIIGHFSKSICVRVIK